MTTNHACSVLQQSFIQVFDGCTVEMFDVVHALWLSSLKVGYCMSSHVDSCLLAIKFGHEGHDTSATLMFEQLQQSSVTSLIKHVRLADAFKQLLERLTSYRNAWWQHMMEQRHDIDRLCFANMFGSLIHPFNCRKCLLNVTMHGGETQ